MAWSQDEERMLAMIERYLSDEDPKLAARIESFNQRVERKERGRRAGGRTWRRHFRRGTVVMVVSWLLIAALITTLLIVAVQHNAAAVPL